MPAKLIVAAVAALILWVCWLARYEVQLRGAQGPVVVVLLDRWTGTVYWSVTGEPWQEIKDADTKRAATGEKDPAAPVSEVAPAWAKDVDPAKKPPVMREWETAPLRPQQRGDSR